MKKLIVTILTYIGRGGLEKGWLTWLII